MKKIVKIIKINRNIMINYVTKFHTILLQFDFE